MKRTTKVVVMLVKVILHLLRLRKRKKSRMLLVLLMWIRKESYLNSLRVPKTNARI